MVARLIPMHKLKHARASILALLFAVTIFVSVQMSPASALVPNIVNVSSHDVGSTTVLDIEISHQPPPAIDASHYIANVQLQINGTIVDLPQNPQNTETFTVQYSLGPNTNSYSVIARAGCTLHGYSSFSSSVTIPEFSLAVIALFMALATIAVVVTKKAQGRLQRV